MKLTQKKCNIMLPKMKSANALWEVVRIDPRARGDTEGICIFTYLS